MNGKKMKLQISFTISPGEERLLEVQEEIIKNDVRVEGGGVVGTGEEVRHDGLGHLHTTS